VIQNSELPRSSAEHLTELFNFETTGGSFRAQSIALKSITVTEDALPMQHRWNYSPFGRTALAAAALAAFLMFTVAPLLHADDHDCQRRIARADHKLDQAVARHGFQSRQADRARNELRAERERCWNTNHRWWDEHGNRWHTERDWDDHDHDHDHDRDHVRDHDHDNH